ncbi:uncharacterized protein LOC143225820 [Tachypleus tridentatus]|uniref:uncharacterized protein LOC143225820 n=1 Tax=Tachypleus tridentatus TaxID=6853 RepID=UPI003FD03A1C
MKRKIATRSNGKALSNEEIMEMLNKAIEGPASESLSSSTESSESEYSGAEEISRQDANATSNKRRLKKKKDKNLKPIMSVNKERYDDSYLQYGFISIIINGEERPRYVICTKSLSNDSMKQQS